MRRLARPLAVVLAVGAVLGFVLPPSGDPFYPPLIAIPGYGTVGLILALKRPGNAFGWLMLGMSNVTMLARLLPVPVEVQSWMIASSIAGLLVLFPTGRPASPGWMNPIAAVAFFGLAGNLFGILTLGDLELPVSIIAGGSSVLVCLAAPIARSRTADDITRSQLRWLGFAASAGGLGLTLVGLGVAFSQPAVLGFGGGLVVLIVTFGFPIAILIAITRYRLYEIDRLIRRSVSYLLVVAALGAIFAIPALVLSDLVGSQSDVFTAGATLAVAMSFSPLRRKVRRWVDRRFDRTSYDMQREIEALESSLRIGIIDTQLVAHVAEILDRSLRPSKLSIWMRS